MEWIQLTPFNKPEEAVEWKMRIFCERSAAGDCRPVMLWDNRVAVGISHFQLDFCVHTERHIDDWFLSGQTWFQTADQGEEVWRCESRLYRAPFDEPVSPYVQILYRPSMHDYVMK